MKYLPTMLILLGFGIAHAAETTPPAESCAQIREQIRAHIGVPAKPNTDLLSKVGANRQCRFTSAEAYRAAWGDKPIPKEEARTGRHERHHHDD